MADIKQISDARISGIFIVIFVSLFVTANLAGFYSLPLFLISMSAAFAFAFSRPLGGIYAIVFLTFIFERFFTLQPLLLGRIEYKIYPLDIVLAAVLVGLIFQRAVKRKFRPPGKKELKTADWCLIGFITLSAMYFLASFFTTNSHFNLAASSFKHYSFYPLLYFAILGAIRNKEHLSELLKFALAGAAAIIIFVIYGLITGQGLWSKFTPLSTEGVRTLAFTHGFYLSLALLGIISYMVARRGGININREEFSSRLSSKMQWLLLIFWTIGIIGSMMRHLWGGLLFSLVFIYLILSKPLKFNFRQNSKRVILTLLVLSVMVFYTVVLFPSSDLKKEIISVGKVLYSRAYSLTDVKSDESFFWRSAVWKKTLSEYEKSPILGIGLGRTVPVEIERYREYVEIRDIHNSWLVLLVQLGVVGILLFVILIYTLGRRALEIKNKDWIGIFLPSVLFFCIVVFFFQPYLETNMLGIFFWIILGLIRVKSYENI